MKKSDVKVGQTYTAKVSDRLVPVRIDSVHSKQGWNATNTDTGKRIHVKSAQRLRRRAAENSPTSVPATSTPQPAPRNAPDAKRGRPGGQSAAAKARRTSALDAAAEVLKQAGKAMNCKSLIAAMAEQGLWKSPAGKTPHATLYSAILREISTKGSKARFRKTERGQFAFAG